jgi:hypothetical protein
MVLTCAQVSVRPCIRAFFSPPPFFLRSSSRSLPLFPSLLSLLPSPPPFLVEIFSDVEFFPRRFLPPALNLTGAFQIPKYGPSEIARCAWTYRDCAGMLRVGLPEPVSTAHRPVRLDMPARPLSLACPGRLRCFFAHFVRQNTPRPNCADCPPSRPEFRSQPTIELLRRRAGWRN